MAGVFAAAVVASAYAPARADDILKKITIETAPVYSLNTAGDAMAPAPAGTHPMGYNGSNPQAHDWRMDYGINYQINRRTKFYYTHDVLDFNLDRVLWPVRPGVTLSLVSGAVSDRYDRVGFSYAVTRQLLAKAYFLDHERSYVSGICLNQVTCGGVTNPNAMGMHGYAVGTTYGFGPRTKIGNIFAASLDAQYIPRPAAPPVPSDKPAAYGMTSWPGSKVLFPYSISAQAPLGKDPTLVGFVGYSRAAEYLRNNASQNLYNVTTFGLVKAFNRNFSVSVTNLNYKECTCSDTVTPPDNLRAAGVFVKFNYKFTPAELKTQLAHL
jgi:hypothetical protein